MHDSVIHSLDELAAYTKRAWQRSKMERRTWISKKRIGDFACYVFLIYGVFAR